MCFLVCWHLSIYYFGCQHGLSSALSSAHFARFTFPEGFFFQPCSAVTAYNFCFGLSSKMHSNWTSGAYDEDFEVCFTSSSLRPLCDLASAVSVFHTAAGSCGLLIRHRFPGCNQEGLKRITYSSHCWMLCVEYGLYNDRNITLKENSMDGVGEWIFLMNFVAQSMMLFVAQVFVCSLTERGANFPEITLV